MQASNAVPIKQQCIPSRRATASRQAGRRAQESRGKHGRARRGELAEVVRQAAQAAPLGWGWPGGAIGREAAPHAQGRQLAEGGGWPGGHRGGWGGSGGWRPVSGHGRRHALPSRVGRRRRRGRRCGGRYRWRGGEGRGPGRGRAGHESERGSDVVFGRYRSGAAPGYARRLAGVSQGRAWRRLASTHSRHRSLRDGARGVGGRKRVALGRHDGQNVSTHHNNGGAGTFGARRSLSLEDSIATSAIRSRRTP